MKDIELIAVISDADAARLVSNAALADLAERITATPIGGASGVERVARRPRRSARRRWLISVPAAAGLAAAVTGAVLASPGQQVSPVHHPGPAGSRTTQAQVLSFTRDGGYIDVIVRDPLADPARYRAEFRAHGLNITLKLVPASPSIVGTLVYEGYPASGSALSPIIAKGRCFTGGGGPRCPVGVRVPLSFKGQADLVFGRAARPGEQYESTADATAPGEALHGLSITGQRLATVLALLKQRHQTVVQFRSDGKTPDQVPGTWYVYSADPWEQGQVLLFVGKTPQPPAAAPPGPGQPVPTPTAPAG